MGGKGAEEEGLSLLLGRFKILFRVGTILPSGCSAAFSFRPKRQSGSLGMGVAGEGGGAVSGNGGTAMYSFKLPVPSPRGLAGAIPGWRP